MTNSETLKNRIDDTYGTHDEERKPYEQLKALHLRLIEEMGDKLIDVNVSLPDIGSEVFCVQDLSSIGKGVFLDCFFYNEHGFVANLTDDDAYGYITKWCYMKDV